MLWQLFLIVLVLFIYFQKWNRRKVLSFYEKYKSSNSYNLPFIGFGYNFIGKNKEGIMRVIQETSEECYQKDGLGTLFFGSKPYLLVVSPAPAKTILMNCLEKGDLMDVCKVLTGNGSIFAPVPIWRPRRKIMAPTFSIKNLNRFVKIFDEKSQIMIDRLREVNNGAFSIWSYLEAYSVDAVCETTLGVNVQAQCQPTLPFLQSLAESLRMIADRFFKPWLFNPTVYSLLPESRKLHQRKTAVYNFISDIIQNKKASLMQANGEIKKPKEGIKSFLELLIESSKISSGAGYGDLELQEETFIIVTAGTDTSAVAASYTTVLLSTHPDIQDKCYEELQEVFGESDREVTAEDLPRLKYLEAVIRESLRLYPPVPFIVRKCEEDLVLPSGDILPEGYNVWVNIFAMHRNPEYWGKDATSFRPERFLNSGLKHPDAYMPFSFGPRACTGYQYALMSMKTVMANLLRNFRLLPAGDSSGTQDQLRVEFDVMMRHVDNYPLRLAPRRGRQ